MTRKTTNTKELNINHSFKLTLLVLSVLSFASLIIAMNIQIELSAPVYFLLAVMLFPMSHLFSSYNAILQVRVIDGLKSNEIRRLNHTVRVRANNIIKVMILYIVVISLVVTLGVIGFLSTTQSLLLSLSVIISSLIDTKLAWDTLAEIRDFEQTILLRNKRLTAHAEIMKDTSNS